MGKEAKKEWLYVHGKQIYFIVHLKLIQDCKLYLQQNFLEDSFLYVG